MSPFNSLKLIVLYSPERQQPHILATVETTSSGITDWPSVEECSYKPRSYRGMYRNNDIWIGQVNRVMNLLNVRARWVVAAAEILITTTQFSSFLYQPNLHIYNNSIFIPPRHHFHSNPKPNVFTTTTKLSFHLLSNSLPTSSTHRSPPQIISAIHQERSRQIVSVSRP